MRILSLIAENHQAQAHTEAQGIARSKDRTGMYTTALVVRVGERTICLYYSGRSHAGENLKALLEQRQANLGKPLVMSDALSRNAVDEDQLIRCHCLAHGRRQFSDLEDVFPQECQVVLQVLSQVFDHDEQARKEQLSPQTRLAYHQAQSQPLMEALKKWLDTQLDDLLDRACAALELSPTQHQTAEARYRAIGQWLSAPGTVLARFRPEIYPQGSLRIGTTVRPFARLEYDLDLVCELVGLDWQQVRNPIAVLNTAEQRLREHDTYKHMLERKNRCIRVNYANEFHLDVLPGCPHPGDGTDRILVPDRKAQAWTASNPKGYADWFEARCALGEAVIKAIQPLPAQEPADMKATLKRIVQLLKRWRDLRYRHDPANAPISIVLTTLAGTYYSGEGSISLALGNVLGAIVASIPRNGHRLLVLNPANANVPADLGNFTPVLIWQDQHNSYVKYDSEGNPVTDASCGGGVNAGCPNTPPSTYSRPTSCTSWTSAPDRSMLLGSRSMPSTLVLCSTSCAVTSRSMSRL